CADEPSLERCGLLGQQMGDQRPVFPRYEFFDFEFAVADEAKRHRLDSTGRTGAGQFAPQHRGEAEANEIVESAPRQISIDQRSIDAAWMFHCFKDRVLGNSVEDDTIDGLILENALALEDLENVPGDRLPLAIGVGGEDDALAVPDGTRYFRQALG